jgi:hypothetical protein
MTILSRAHGLHSMKSWAGLTLKAHNSSTKKDLYRYVMELRPRSLHAEAQWRSAHDLAAHMHEESGGANQALKDLMKKYAQTRKTP